MPHNESYDCHRAYEILLPALRAYEARYGIEMWLEKRRGRIFACCKGGHKVVVWEISDKTQEWKRLWNARMLELAEKHGSALRALREGEFWGMRQIAA